MIIATTAVANAVAHLNVVVMASVIAPHLAAHEPALPSADDHQNLTPVLFMDAVTRHRLPVALAPHLLSDARLPGKNNQFADQAAGLVEAAMC